MNSGDLFDPSGDAGRESEKIFQALLEWAPEAILFQDVDRSEWIEANAAAEKLFGCSREELLARGPWSFYLAIQPDGLPLEQSIRKNVERVLAGDALTFERIILNAHGEELHCEVQVVRLPYARRNVLRAIFRNITERKHAEREIEHLNRLYAVLSHVNQAVIRSTSKQELMDQICRAAIEFGAFKAAWIGMLEEASSRVLPVALAGGSEEYVRKLKVYTDDRPEGRGPIGNSIRSGHPFVANDFGLDPTTRPWHEDAAAAGIQGVVSLPIRNGGKICGVLVVYSGEQNFFQAKEMRLLEEVASDISFALDHLDQEQHRQDAEEALKASKESAEAANRAKDQFIAVLSHELRTPLTPVLATVALMKERGSISSELRDEMDLIHRNIDLEARLIDDLLDVTRISRGVVELRREVVDIHAALRRAFEICESDIIPKRIAVSMNLAARHHAVWADAARIQQVFWNLIKNAVKFTSEDGRIAIETLNIGKRLRIDIRDSGVGIEPDVLPRIFNPFEQGEQTRNRRFGGLGLGLSIAKSVVDLHKGRIEALSGGHGQGSVFRVELETVDRICRHSARRPEPPARNADYRILLVEDHADTLRMLTRLLTHWGYNVQTADSVQHALEAASREEFDLLISDLGLPDGSGLDIMRATKERYGIRGIALSGFGTDDDYRSTRAAGFEEHLTKPIGLDMLRAAVERMTDGKIK